MTRWKVIYFRTRPDNHPAREIIEKQCDEKRQKIYAYIDELEIKGNMIDRSISKKISRNIFELKVSDMRILYYFGNGNYIVIVHTVIKKRQDLDNADIKLAEKNRREFIERFGI
jgi:phage-related protein